MYVKDLSSLQQKKVKIYVLAEPTLAAVVHDDSRRLDRLELKVYVDGCVGAELGQRHEGGRGLEGDGLVHAGADLVERCRHLSHKETGLQLRRIRSSSETSIGQGGFVHPETKIHSTSYERI